jgi:hypothetical protein
MLGVLAVNKLGFGLALAEVCQNFVKRQCHRGVAYPKSATQSPLNISTSLIGPIWSK